MSVKTQTLVKTEDEPDHERHHHHDESCECGHEHHHHHHDENCDCGHEHHHHHHDESCDCGHEHHHHHHDESCDCGHEHHHHHHDESCDCGHEHHHHHHDKSCDCGHGHEHAHAHEQNERPTAKSHGKAKGIKRVYSVQNLGCAHCAAEMEYQIGRLAGVNECVLVYETKQLRVIGDNPDSLLPDIRKICSSIESEAKVIAPEDSSEEVHSPVWELVSGAVFFIAGLMTPTGVGKLCLFLAAYLVLGWRVVWTALRNLSKGRVFDENFLMSLATIGAVGIQEYSEAVGVMLFYRLGEFFEDKAVERSRGQIMSAVDLRPETVRLDDGREIPAEDAKVGDVLTVRPGDRIPLDGEVLEGESRLDTSAVTGEPVPVRAVPGDAVVSGCVNTDGVLKIRVTHVLSESMVQRILDSVENAAARKPRLDRFITRFSRVYTPAVVATALLTVLVPGVITGDWSTWIHTALTFLVISCPCALVLSVPLSYFAGIGAGSKRGILFKGGSSLEMLETVKTVVMDKTGTITRGDFSVKSVKPAKDHDKTGLLALAEACERESTHPIAKSIQNAAEKAGIRTIKVLQVHECAGEGIEAELENGKALCGSRKLLEKHGIDLRNLETQKGNTEVLLALNGEFAGQIVIADTLKTGASEAIARLKKQGLHTAMLTGDSAESAEAVAATAGINEVRARLLPNEKLEALSELREKYGAAMFVGDGINDAPVLAGADVGAAMGTGADAAIEAADVVFMTSELSAIPDAVEISRSTGKTARQNIAFALGIKALVMVLGLLGHASMWLAVFADSGVAMLCVLNSIRILYRK